MAKKAALGSRAWNLLRLALYWARKGGIFKRGLLADLLRNHLKFLRSTSQANIGYGERELSFDETPMFNFKLHHHRSDSTRFRYLPHIPCINPFISFNDDEDDDYNGNYFGSRGFSDYYVDDKKESKCGSYRTSTSTSYNDTIDDDNGNNCSNEINIHEKKGEIDIKAEEFIANFYKQMKLQRQISYLQYNEMLQRGSC